MEQIKRCETCQHSTQETEEDVVCCNLCENYEYYKLHEDEIEAALAEKRLQAEFKFIESLDPDELYWLS